jgi:phosphoglycolate phosphatase-like HAD superfamily hydrolase
MTEAKGNDRMPSVEIQPTTAAPVILFDLDRTLLDVQRMGELIAHNFDDHYRDFGVTPGMFQQWADEYSAMIGSTSNYSLATLASYLHEQMAHLIPTESDEPRLVPPKPAEIEAQLTAFVQLMANDCLYDDVVETIRALKQMGCIVCLFSQGVITWQELKIAHTELSSLIDNDLQFVSTDKTSEAHLHEIQAILLKRGFQDRAVWLVDDKPSILQRAKNGWPEVQTILMIRGTQAAVGEASVLEPGPEAIERLSALINRVESLKAASPASE